MEGVAQEHQTRDTHGGNAREVGLVGIREAQLSGIV
jgi:hypothetical protein